ncbi:tyrosine-protein phosphatase [Rhodococcus cercidiphylli]|uniref:Tyrosine-protein phosphatase n=1 Tax=Rhodococcus cercidiphylli TaxID=489916 RepID=A0ABU4AWH9_9NOCA|nr:tyrosine-protein phosphatase [Rhodococcus cercidiphylli]MDV6230594.1 tyrosine-protein phosphatase [Rhodococcus cercidiphylli]
MTSNKSARSVSGTSADPAELVPGTTNTRAIPRFHTSRGGTIRGELLYRGDVVGPAGSTAECVWSEKHSADFIGLGLRTVVDLRSEKEAETVPSAWAAMTAARLVHAPIQEGVEGSDTDFMRLLRGGSITSFTPSDLAEWYLAVLRRRGPTFGRAVRGLSEPDSMPALVHCHAGKDRTGLLVALILGTLGVARADIVADYAQTAVHRVGRAEDGRLFVEGLGLKLDDVRTLWDAPALTMEKTLDGLDAEYGGSANYLLTEGGLADHELDALRSSLVEQETTPQ